MALRERVSKPQPASSLNPAELAIINKGGTPVVLDVTYVVPSGGPLRNEAPAPKCAEKL